jgi:putative SOS response-associated peptidase YedK
MCGRYKLVTAPAELEIYFEAIISNAGTIEPILNVTPGMFMPVLAVGRDQVPVITTFKWGLVPSWSKDPKTGYKMINARSETITQKPSYATPFQRRRCIIPANGFYEWMKDGTARIPHFVHRTDDDIMSFAGIYDRFKYPDGKDLFTYSIITTSANEQIKHIHDRMPVVVDKEQIKVWLSPDTNEHTLIEMMKPLPDVVTTFEQVTNPAK